MKQQKDTYMVEKTKNSADATRVETKIVFEAPRKSMGQTIVIWIIETIIGLAIVAGLGYAFLNFTPAGEELKVKYERSSRKTIESLDEGVEFCRFYASYMGHPPASQDEVLRFQKERIANPYRQYFLSSGERVPYWNARDGFGHVIQIDINPNTRTVRLTSPGLLPISGDKPGFFNITHETSY